MMMEFIESLIRKTKPIPMACIATVFMFTSLTWADDTPQSTKVTPRQRNGSSQRYEVNQTFDGSAFFKDNNVWVYNKEFADLFGMPKSGIEDLQGIAAAAFRIEDTSYQQCGFGGNPNACRKTEECLIDLYFDESKTPLPWATDIKSQWVPSYASMRWLRPLDPKEHPHGLLAIDPLPEIIRNDVLHSQLIPFADPISKRQAIFTSNAWANGGEEGNSGSMPILGYVRNHYKQLSIISLQFGCGQLKISPIYIRLDARSEVFDPPIARFNRLVLPQSFVQKISALQKENSDKNALFYRSLFPSPIGTGKPEGECGAGWHHHLHSLEQHAVSTLQSGENDARKKYLTTLPPLKSAE